MILPSFKLQRRTTSKSAILKVVSQKTQIVIPLRMFKGIKHIKSPPEFKVGQHG